MDQTTNKDSWARIKKEALAGLPFNEILSAYNAAEFAVPLDVIDECRQFYETHVQRELEQRSAADGEALGFSDSRDHKWRTHEWNLFVHSPAGWKYCIDWVYPEDLQTRAVFSSLFERLMVREFCKENELGIEIDFEHDIQMLAGSLVVRVGARDCPHWHVDYEWSAEEQAKQLYTLMTPLYDMAGHKDGHLLYKDVDNKDRVYQYQLGKAIIFGMGFEHATQPCTDSHVKAFLCFSFGTDKFRKYQHALTPPAAPPVGSAEFSQLVNEHIFQLSGVETSDRPEERRSFMNSLKEPVLEDMFLNLLENPFIEDCSSSDDTD